MIPTLDIPLWQQLVLAGALGGVIRWLTVASHWRAGIGHILAGAIMGNYLGAFAFALLRPMADLSIIQPTDAQLLGAHIAGVVGINLYTIPSDYIRAWKPSPKASDPKEPKP